MTRGPGAEGTVEVWAVTDHLAAAACPDCGTVSGRVHETVLARPRDVRRGIDPVRVWWIKRRWKCQDGRCDCKTFTEWLPQVPPRCRVTGRLRAQAGAEVAERGITAAEAARRAGVSWPVAHAAFAAAADPVLGQAEGRTADDAAYWLARAAPAWRDAVRVVATGMCSIYASAARRMLPGAQIAVDLFHVVHLAVKMTGDVRRRVVRGKYGRRGRSGDPGYGIKSLLVRNLEHLSPAQFAKVTGIVGSDPAGQEIAAAWIAKQKLRHTLNLRPRRRLRAVRAQRPGPALRLLRLVRPER